MKFNGIQASRIYKQINNAKPEDVFPLLCPVREKDWVDGWDYKMIFSKSGLIEKDCVFSTSHHGNEETIWYVTDYDKDKFKLEFVRVTPHEEVVKINIYLVDNGNGTTTSIISYQYTGLNESKNEWIEDKLDIEFKNNMIEWEKAINYYLEKGEKLMK
ncbi:MAG: hypothetical protein H6Q15_2258 [Bacteroidetes bacterium]|nr:hypothetical protein [Bacteroidota bacterium]